MRAARPLAAAAALAALLGQAAAQERPSDEDLFGAPPAAPQAPPAQSAPAAAQPAAATPPPAAAPGADPRAEELLGGARREVPTGRWERGQEDALAVGGLLYLRGTASWSRGVPPADWPVSAPSILDAYLDARPNDRVRAFALGRLFHDPTVATQGLDPAGRPVTRPQTRAVLDQLFVNFDLGRTVFVTAGKQHVKWGTGRFWNPGDFLHPVRRDPLAQLDDRTGVTMVRAHLPWEARGWNLYAVALLEDLAGDTSGAAEGPRPGTAGKVGGAARAEVVLGGAELAMSAAAQRGHAPRFGLDGSFALWELDLKGELTLTKGRDVPAFRATGEDVATLAGWERDPVDRITPQVVLGASWSWKYSDEDALTLGGEWFHNGAGYDDAHVYPVLLASPYAHLLATPRPFAYDPRVAFTPFYLGRQYAGVFLTAPRPGPWNDTTLTASALANLSDGSGLVRLDHAVVLNTYLTLETYLAGHLGKRGGEFRFGLDVPGQPLPIGGSTPPLSLPTPVLDAGVALRVKL